MTSPKEKMPTRKRIGGRIYMLHCFHEKKRNADATAAKLRRQGHQARVFCNSGICAVYSRE